MAELKSFRSSYTGVQSMNRISEWTSEEIGKDSANWQLQRTLPGRTQRSLNEIDFILYTEENEILSRETALLEFMGELGLLDIEK